MFAQHFECPSCKDSFCLQCKAVEDGSKGFGPSHKGLDCEAFRAKMASDSKLKKQHEKRHKQALESKEDVAFAKLMKAEAAAGATKPCPGCGEAITHVEGCDHHQCPMCNAL